MNTQLPSAAQVKDQAKRLRTKMSEDGASIGHAKSLELVAHQHGFRDWNTMFAAIGNGRPRAGPSVTRSAERIYRSRSRGM